MKFLDREEIRVLDLLEAAGHRVFGVDRVHRGSARYDLDVRSVRLEGGRDVEYATWLPATLIREFVSWRRHEVAALTTAPTQVQNGDWSLIRDRRDVALRILTAAVDGYLPLSNLALAPKNWNVVEYAHRRERNLTSLAVRGLTPKLTRAQAEAIRTKKLAPEWADVPEGLTYGAPAPVLVQVLHNDDVNSMGVRT